MTYSLLIPDLDVIESMIEEAGRPQEELPT